MSTLRRGLVLKCGCCGDTGPCACPIDDPWIAGRAESVKMTLTFSGISASAPTPGWGCVRPYVDWYGVNDLEPDFPGFCEGEDPTEEEICAWKTAMFNEGNTWRTAGTVQNGESGAFDRADAACGTTWDYSFDDGPSVIPDFGTPVDVRFRSDVSISVRYIEAEDTTYVEILGRTVALASVVNFDQVDIEPFTDPCDRIIGDPDNVQYNIIQTGQFVWFRHESTFSGKLCGNASYEFANTAPAHVPLYTDPLCATVGYGGSIRICSGGTATIALADA